jgi:opacity protein-like surface antigen
MERIHENISGNLRLLLRKLSRAVLAPALALLCISANGHAQGDPAFPFTLHVGGGFAPLPGALGTRLDNGWLVNVGGGIKGSHLALTFDYTYFGFTVGRNVLIAAAIPDTNANSHLWSLTLNPRFSLGWGSRFDGYIVGGVGYYRRTVEFTRPTLVRTVIVDQFFGRFFRTVVPANTLLGSIQTSGVGGSLGGGFDIKPTAFPLKIFAEARYLYADTGTPPTRIVPLTVGVRF